MRKISQYWIEDPLRSVSQPVQFTVEGRVDISVGAQFVRSARLLNSGNLPVFSYKFKVTVGKEERGTYWRLAFYGIAGAKFSIDKIFVRYVKVIG